ncbi:hypothetical protein B7463_g8079, partial [Scytalidium lignicola]
MSSSMLSVASKTGWTSKARQTLQYHGGYGEVIKFDDDVDASGSLGLSKLPREVRDMIYEDSILRDVNKKKPAILPALRVHPKYYQEALMVYYRVNEFKLWLDGYDAINPLHFEILPFVKNVKLIFPVSIIMDINNWSIDGYGAVYHPAEHATPKVKKIFDTVEKLTIRFADLAGMCALLVFLRHNNFPRLKKLVIEDVMNHCSDFDGGAKLDEWNEKFGVPAKLLTVPATPVMTIESYVWFPIEGNSLEASESD